MLSCSSAIYFSVKITYLLICHLLLAHFSDFLVLHLLTHGLPSPPPELLNQWLWANFYFLQSPGHCRWPGLETTLWEPQFSSPYPLRSYSSLVKTTSMFTLLLLLLLLLLSFHVVILLLTALLPLFFLLSEVFFFQFYWSIIDAHRKLKVYSIMVWLRYAVKWSAQ